MRSNKGKRRNTMNRISLLLLVFSVLLAACAAPAPEVTVTAQMTVTLESPRTPTETPVPSPTLTPEPTATAKATETQIPAANMTEEKFMKFISGVVLIGGQYNEEYTAESVINSKNFFSGLMIIIQPK
jgi:hypothetical protein